MPTSDEQKELFAKILSWAIIGVIVFIIAMAIVFVILESATLVSGAGLVGVFAMIITYSNGLFILVIGGLIMALFALLLVFSLLIKSGQRIFLKLIWKVEEVSTPTHIKPRSKKDEEEE